MAFSREAARFVVAALLLIEAAVLFAYGVTWPVPYPFILTTVIGLMAPGASGWVRKLFIAVAVAYAGLFILPGGIFALLGSCGGMMNSSCSNQEFMMGVAGYAIAAIVNIIAAALILKSGAAKKT
jgi:hypothetical protein